MQCQCHDELCYYYEADYKGLHHKNLTQEPGWQMGLHIAYHHAITSYLDLTTSVLISCMQTYNLNKELDPLLE